jgi:glycosyltransferase involved in cell wall biosynthesis
MRKVCGWCNRFAVGFVGRLVPEKHLPTLVRATAVSQG